MLRLHRELLGALFNVGPQPDLAPGSFRHGGCCSCLNRRGRRAGRVFRAGTRVDNGGVQMKIVGMGLAVALMAAPAAAGAPAAVAATDNARMATAGGMVASVDAVGKSLVVKVEGQKGDAH